MNMNAFLQRMQTSNICVVVYHEYCWLSTHDCAIAEGIFCVSYFQLLLLKFPVDQKLDCSQLYLVILFEWIHISNVEIVKFP